MEILKAKFPQPPTSRLGNPKGQDFHKCFDPKTDQQLSQVLLLLSFLYLGKEKKEKRSTLYVLTLGDKTK